MPADPRFPAPDPRELDPYAVRRSFARAAPGYDAAAVLQREIAGRMAQRLDYVKLKPGAILDAGCGTGEALGELAARYPDASLVGLDLAVPMLQIARSRSHGVQSTLRRLLRPVWREQRSRMPGLVCGDMQSLPLRGVAFDLVWSNLALQWVNDLPRAFAEFRRVLRVGGLLTFTTFGPDTLKELRKAFARVDSHTHTSRFIDMHDIGDDLVRAGFADPVMDAEFITVTYPAPQALLSELKAIGATNATRDRPRGLMGAGRWRRMQNALSALAVEGRIPATFEVVYGHAWKGEPRQTSEGHAVVRFERPPRSS
ncbi:MAG TPA: malonyl-ACP O-methyltransferase BioC [Casimicrobiaceae bacterium]|nr:malonyl-ACP O-methyltransferase BioC [Casimicrobiaceae bacterium]